MKRCLFGIVATLCFLISPCSAQEQKTFSGSGPYFNYSIEYPASWNAADLYGFAELTPPGQAAGKFKEKILVTVADMGKGKPALSLEAFNDLWLKVIPGEVSRFELLEKGETTLAGRRALFSIYKGNKDKVKIKGKRYIFAQKNSIYELVFEAQERNFKADLPMAERIIAGLKLQ